MPRMKVVSSKAFQNCPNHMLTASHFIDAPEGRCRCFLKRATEMEKLGYAWDKQKGRWI